MIRKVLISLNGYKECAEPVYAAGVISSILKNHGFETFSAPLSDGGDGFLDVCSEKYNLQKKIFPISAPDGREINASSGYNLNTRTLYIESAECVGLKIVPLVKRDPMNFSSQGLGQLIRQAVGVLAIKKIVIGIGGTAVNDLGLGMLCELGLHLFDDYGNTIFPLPSHFDLIKTFHWDPAIHIDFELVIDVNNPLTGKNGSAFTFGPQKGMKTDEIEFLDVQFSRLAELFGGRINNLSGAGGGIAAGLQLFMNAAIKSSTEFILKDLQLDNFVDKYDAVITGEGNFDTQSFSGKGSGIIIQNCRKPVFLLCGDIEKNIKLPQNVIPITLQKYFDTREESIRQFEKGLVYTVEEIIQKIKEMK